MRNSLFTWTCVLVTFCLLQALHQTVASPSLEHETLPDPLRSGKRNPTSSDSDSQVAESIVQDANQNSDSGLHDMQGDVHLRKRGRPASSKSHQRPSKVPKSRESQRTASRSTASSEGMGPGSRPIPRKEALRSMAMQAIQQNSYAQFKQVLAIPDFEDVVLKDPALARELYEAAKEAATEQNFGNLAVLSNIMSKKGASIPYRLEFEKVMGTRDEEALSAFLNSHSEALSMSVLRDFIIIRTILEDRKHGTRFSALVEKAIRNHFTE